MVTRERAAGASAPVSGLWKERPLARHKYGIEKRQRELKKEQKKEEKRLRKLDRKTSQEGDDPSGAPESGEADEPEPGA